MELKTLRKNIEQGTETYEHVILVLIDILGDNMAIRHDDGENVQAMYHLYKVLQAASIIAKDVS